MTALAFTTDGLKRVLEMKQGTSQYSGDNDLREGSFGDGLNRYRLSSARFFIPTDILARLAPAAFCIYVLSTLVKDLPRSPLYLASRLSVIAFLVISLILFLIRRRAIAKAPGVYVRLVAFMGAFLMMLAPLISAPVQHRGFLLLGTLLTLVGNTLSVMALYSLGRAFSIMAEARQLVTTGTYRYCRHPLYLSEGIAVMGVITLYFSPITILVAILYVTLQYGRIREEERILESVFPDYKAYKGATPMLIPRRT